MKVLPRSKFEVRSWTFEVQDSDVERPTSNFERRTRCHRGRGFTLAEVLVTLLFLAIVLPVAMRGVSLALAAASNARNTREATSLAQQKLQELTTITMPRGTQTGDFSPEHPDYRWTCQTSSTSYGVYQLDLRVSWTDRGQERGINLSTLFNPDLMSATDDAAMEATP